MSITSTISEFKALLSKLTEQTKQYNSIEFESRKEKGKWSKKEILGHLIDSALANLERFNKIQFSPSLMIIESYPQDELVKSNNYQAKDLEDIVRLFLDLNYHILFVMETKLVPHAQKEISINGMPSDLAFLCSDYLAHLQHHLKQLS